MSRRAVCKHSNSCPKKICAWNSFNDNLLFYVPSTSKHGEKKTAVQSRNGNKMDMILPNLLQQIQQTHSHTFWRSSWIREYHPKLVLGIPRLCPVQSRERKNKIPPTSISSIRQRGRTPDGQEASGASIFANSHSCCRRCSLSPTVYIFYYILFSLTFFFPNPREGLYPLSLSILPSWGFVCLHFCARRAADDIYDGMGGMGLDSFREVWRARG